MAEHKPQSKELFICEFCAKSKPERQQATNEPMVFFKTEWRFDAEGKPVNLTNDDATATAVANGIRVRVLTKLQVIAMEETLRPQIEALYTPVLAAIPDAPTTAASAAQGVFTIKKDPEATKETPETQDPPANERHLIFLVHWESNDDALETSRQLIGFTRIREEPDFSAIVGSPLIIDISLSQQRQEAVQRALFCASQAIGEALAQKLLIEKRVKAELAADAADKNPVPESSAFWRSIFIATEFTKKLLLENGFSDNNLRLEMSIELSKIKSEEAQDHVLFPDGIQVKPIDLSDSKSVLAAYDVIKMAFGPSPPSFEAWKIHYAQQPRFASELSFIAWDGDEAVAAVMIERIVDGEGGGDDEVSKVYATHAKLLAAGTSGVAGDTSEPSVATLEFTEDFDERKERITHQATIAYVCGAATKPDFRGKGLASGLLQRAFHEAAQSPLQEITLGTDAINKSAVRAYERAGMVETKRFSSGMTLTKQIAFVHDEP